MQKKSSEVVELVYCNENGKSHSHSIYSIRCCSPCNASLEIVDGSEKEKGIAELMKTRFANRMLPDIAISGYIFDTNLEGT